MKTLMLLAATAAMIAGPVLASEGRDIGKREYQQSCATCHGLDGKGKGSFAQALELSVPDLTTLASRNEGVFPVSRVYGVIDGREAIKAHGTREMPIWGRHFGAGAFPAHDDYGFDPEVAARSRILLLIDYLYRIQSR